MSYVVGTSQDALTLDQDYPGGIPVAVCGVTAVLATEGSFGQLSGSLFLARHFEQVIVV